ncbi:MAG TPA: TRAP transporter small permease [Methylomirabilota bacterium]|nr:TRAP transporter small permease [Methylomirabilota bacterium]
MPGPRVLSAALRAYFRLLQIVLTGLLGLMIIPVTLQIFSRYTGLIPRYIWTEEVARFCFIWIIMLGAMVAVREGTHFEVDVLRTPRTARGEAVMRLVVCAFMLIFALVFVGYGYRYAAFGYTQTSELTGINLIFIHGAYLVAGLTWVAFLGERILIACAVLGGDEAAIERLRGNPDVAR